MTLARDGLGGEALDVGAEDSVESWATALSGIDAVYHLAGIAHRMADPAAIEQINERWTLTLFRAAGAAGVQDFVWLSSIKVLGEQRGCPLRESDPYAEAEADIYTAGKIRAERGLLELESRFPGTRMAILRPPLVYGPGVKANFLSLLIWARRCERGLPLPLGAARAPRSLIGVWNLCDVMLSALGHRGIFHCADSTDLSVVDLLTNLGARRRLLLPVPAGVMAHLLRLAGADSVYQRLYRPLQVDQRRSNEALGWTPTHSAREQLVETVSWFQSR